MTSSNLKAEETQIVEQLREELNGTETYLRSHNLAKKMDLSAKQIGNYLGRLDDKVDEFDIEPWAEHTSTTWRIQPAQ